MRILVWFQRDLRLHDHALLQRVQDEGHEVLCVYCFDEEEKVDWPDGSPRWSDRKRKFLLESLHDLYYGLERLGVHLLYREGPTSEVLAELAWTHQIDEVWYSFTAGTEERRRAAAVAEVLPLRHFETQSLLEPADLPFELAFMPAIFTEFRKRVEKFSGFRPPQGDIKSLRGIQTDETSELPDPPRLENDERTAFPFQGGEENGRQRLQQWMWNGDNLRHYKETRNGLLGTDYSSKFSPWIAWGCLSPRYIVDEVRKYENERGANRSTYWLIFELLWRDFFHFTWRKEGGNFFKMPERFPYRPGPNFIAWKQGETGEEFIDANMRELAATGFMSNRGRQNVGSYLVHHLKEDWVHGARWFESQLIDYEPCNNYGNWTYVAGVGNDPRENRVFNPEKQAERYDPEKRYINTWNK